MTTKRFTLAALALVALVAVTLACNLPTPAGDQEPPATVTPFVPSDGPGPDDATQPPPPADTPEPPPPTNPPLPTNTPLPPAPTDTPQPVSEGPLDFEEPRWIHAWEPAGGGQNLVTVKITIIGGAPPFTVSHGPNVVGTTSDRVYFIEFERGGCTGITQSITVASADGQSIKKDYWISTDDQPWCP